MVYDDKHYEALKILENIPGLTIKSHVQAEHCGAHYFTFTATEEALRNICKRKDNWINVHLDDNDEVEYRLRLGLGYEINQFLGVMP